MHGPSFQGILPGPVKFFADFVWQVPKAQNSPDLLDDATMHHGQTLIS